MKRSYLTSAVAALTVWSAFAAPVFAAQDGRRAGARAEGRQEGQASPRTSEPRDNGSRPASPAPQAAPRVQSVPRAAQPRFEQRVDQPRAAQPPQRSEQPRAIPPQQRVEQPRAVQPQQRFEQPRAGQSQGRFEQPRAVQPPLRFEQRRFDDRRFDDRRFDNRRFEQRRYVRPGIVSRPYYRPYYTFRPRLSLGFGLWIGYPIQYSTYGPNYSPYPYVYPYARSTYPVQAPGTVALVPTGGLSFDITPADAEIYVDGQYVGVVGDFAPTEQPLPLTPGRHRIEIGAPGFLTLDFDVDIIAGQVIPYQGAMQSR